MGPDEFATREEVGFLVKLLLAKIQQQAEMISVVTAKLVANGVITQQQFQELLSQAAESPGAVRAKEREAKLRELLAIRKTAKQYLDPPEESPEGD